MQLVAPIAALEIAFLKMYADFTMHDPDNAPYYAPAEANFAAYCNELQRQERGIVKAGDVPCTTRWLQDIDGDIMGAIRIRHHIDHPYLAIEGGHIGYDIAPSCRNNGHGTQMLRLAIPIAQQLGIPRVMLVTDANNLASQAVIRACGGQLTQTLISPAYGTLILHFWIDL